MLDAFKLKPFDLEPVYASWTTAPRFLGDPKKDPPVDEWLKEIKEGCLKHNVPQEYWHTCAQQFMGERAKARLNELKKVMAQVHGGRYWWNWKKFKVAMRNMSWDIDTGKTETVKVQGPFWWLPKSSKPEQKPEDIVEGPPPTLTRSSTMSRFFSKESPQPEPERPVIVDEPPPILTRSSTMSRFFSKEGPQAEPEPERPAAGRATTLSIWPARKNSKDADQTMVARPLPRKAKSDGAVLFSSQSSKTLPPLPEGAVSTVHAPAWLLNAANALDFLQNEHPRVMSTLGAILIVGGTLPTLPIVSAGAGGAILASSTAHAVGAIAVGIGSWIKTQQETHGAKSA